jgi:hypothetical protein
VRRISLFVAACLVYIAAALTVSPGFYDGIGPSAPYNWTCPPPQAGPSQKPSSGHADIKVLGGVSDPGSAFTADGQAVIGFLPGAFNADGKTVISVDIVPTPNCPQPPGVKFVTNVYEIKANATLVKDSNLTLVYSNLEPAPEAIYYATSANGPWTSLGAQSEAQPFTVWQKVHALGYFAAGYRSGSTSPGTPSVGGGQALPIIVAVLIGVVILAGLPLAVLRRRRGGEQEEEEE